MNTIVETTGTKQRKREQAEIAGILRVYFPGTEFTVRMKKEGGNTGIVIHYTDGVSSMRVWNAVRHFQRHPQPDIHVSGIRIQIERSMSEKVRKILLSEVKSVFNLDKVPQESDYFKPVRGTVGEYMRIIFKMRDF